MINFIGIYNETMIPIISALLVSITVTHIIIKTQKLHAPLSSDHLLAGIQKFHKIPVPRVGGVAVFMGLIASSALAHQVNQENIQAILLVLCSTLVFGIGFTEDLTKVISVRTRLLFTAVGALLATLLLDVQISKLYIPGFDYVLSFKIVSIIFTVFAITGLANAYNIIDGFNGLSSMVGILTLCGIGFVAITLNDSLAAFLCISMAVSILGFFIFNYPRGLIFLGDGGAYLIGFWIAITSILLVNRHQEISPWFALLINAYPVTETLFTIYRRKYYQNKSPGQPDGMHIHTLIYRRILKKSPKLNDAAWFSANAKTSPYLWILSSSSVIFAVLFRESTTTLMLFVFIFITSYIWLFKRIISFKTPGWLKFF